jgi:hypothetical protein
MHAAAHACFATKIAARRVICATRVTVRLHIFFGARERATSSIK